MEQLAYAKLDKLRVIPKEIMDYLIDEVPDFWKLLKYETSPLNRPNLTKTEKSKMICKESFNEEDYNLLFQRYSKDAKIKALSQVRIYIEDVISKDRTSAMARVVFQVIVNNRNTVINTPISPVDRRDIAITQLLIKTLNGVELPSGVIFMDGERDRFAGAKYVAFNTEYSGYELAMDMHVW